MIQSVNNSGGKYTHVCLIVW